MITTTTALLRLLLSLQAVYRVLREAEHRSSSFIPYWKLPWAEKLLASQIEFTADMRLLNTVLDELIAKAIATQQVADVDELEQRDLELADDPR
jgi:cytochrome P450 family 97 subfamily B polypeptide 3